MYSVTLNNKPYNNSTIGATRLDCKVPEKVSAYSVANDLGHAVNFGDSSQTTKVRTTLVNKDEISKYNVVLNNCDKSTKKQMDILLKNGVLLSNRSNDKSTVLDNLYLIASGKRAEGLNTKEIIKNTVEAIANPYSITQQFGDIPKQYQSAAINLFLDGKQANSGSLKSAEEEINIEHSGTCVAASIEFNLAKNYPAEFARFAAGLSSPELAVNKTIQLKNLTDNVLDSVWLLNAFEIPYEMKDYENAVLKIAPDKNAIMRATIQTSNRDKGERSSLDVLMQSAFMNVGSEQSYNTLSDKRKGKFNQNDKGLIEFEKTFTESIVENENKTSITYQKVDENSKLVGYETDFETIKKQLVSALELGHDVIIGYTQTDENNVIINGHEITITDVKLDRNGKMIFTCNDTDDGYSKPIAYSEDYLIPKIHHAALPQEVLSDNRGIPENWVDGLRYYQDVKKNKVA